MHLLGCVDSTETCVLLMLLLLLLLLSQGCLPDKLFAAFKPIPREDLGDDGQEGEQDPFEPSELPSAGGGTQDAAGGVDAAAAMGE
jgi:hypothetical protein